MNPIKFSLVAMALVATAPLVAQDVTSTLVGKVTDAKGHPIQGATIVISGDRILRDKVTTTGADGSYRMTFVPPGTHRIVITKTGWTSFKEQRRVEGGGSTFRVDATLKNIQEVVNQVQSAVVDVVSSGGRAEAQIDKTATETSTTLNVTRLQDMVGANLSNIINLAPGVAGANSIRGGSIQSAAYYVDGLSAKDNVTGTSGLTNFTLADMAESVSVIQSPMNAKYGNTSSGMIQVVTRQGSNEFHGVLRTRLDRGEWTAKSGRRGDRLGVINTTPYYGNADTLDRWHELTLEGPIIKNRLLFAFGTRKQPETTYNYRNSILRKKDAAGNWTGQTGFVWWDGKAMPAHAPEQDKAFSATSSNKYNQLTLSAYLTDSLTVRGGYTRESDVTASAASSVDASNMDKDTTTERKKLSLTLEWTVAANQTLTFKYGKQDESYSYTNGPQAPIVENSGPFGLEDVLDIWDSGYNFTTRGRSTDYRPDGRNSQHYRADYMGVFEGNGSHLVEAGFEHLEPIWDTPSRGNSYPIQFNTAGHISGDVNDGFDVPAELRGKYIVFPYTTPMSAFGRSGSTPIYLNSSYLDYMPFMDIWTGYETSVVRAPSQGLYVNDQWTINAHHQVMMGLRYDRLQIKDASGTKLTTASFNPRFTYKFDLDGDNRRVWELSAGRMRGMPSARVYRNFVTTRLDNRVRRFWDKGTGPYLVTEAEVTNPANYGYIAKFQNGSAYSFDPNLKPDSMDEFSASYKRNFARGGYWRAGVVTRKWSSLYMFKADGDTPVVIQDPTQPNSPAFNTFRRTLTNDPEGYRRYQSFEFEFNAPINDNWFVSGGYFSNRLNGNNFVDNLEGSDAGSTADTGDWRYQLRRGGIAPELTNPDALMGLTRLHSYRLQLNHVVTKGRTRTSTTLETAYRTGDRRSVYNTFNYKGSVPLVDASIKDSTVPKTYTNYWNRPGSHSNPDNWWVNLQFNFEVGITKGTSVFVQATVKNVLNHFFQNSAYWRFPDSADPSTYGGGFKNRRADSRTFGTQWDSTNSLVNAAGARDIDLNLGFRF